jgi:protein-S-isoprenylcysteine O-methyltransferase Ste14
LSPPGWFLAALAAMLALRVAAPGPVWLDPPGTLLGLLPIAAGAALHASAWRAFRSAGTTPEPVGRPAHLVRRGPYARTRNPMYLAGVPILLGVAVLLGSAAPLVIVPAYALGASRWIAREEVLMARRFGAQWEEYRAAVPRWL